MYPCDLSSCPVDETFHWLSVNGRAQMSRFSVEMFTMPQELPIYIHCLANICGPDEDCVKVGCCGADAAPLLASIENLMYPYMI